MRPTHISSADIERWEKALSDDQFTPDFFKTAEPLKEIFMAGYWLMEELKNLKCPDNKIVQIQYSHGSLSYGKEDAWAIAADLLQGYKDGTLEFVDEEEITKQISSITAEIERDPKTQN